MKRVLIIGAQHGNELLGEALFNYIKKYHRELLPFITFRIGNPRAKKAHTRYIETDLNRSYTRGKITYEERRANRLLAYIQNENFDLVIDAHTTTCEEPPCFIAHTLNGSTGEFMAGCDIKKVVRMHPDIAKTSLIGVCAQAVSVEVNRLEVVEPLLELLSQGIANYCYGLKPHDNKTMYEIAGFILKSEISENRVGELRNFQKSPQGFYPILTGENSYKQLTNYLGFKAYKVYETKV